MKKVISTILALVMVLAVVAAIPMTVSAATTRNTGNDLFYKEPSTENPAINNNVSNTGWDAYYGTPTIDGKYEEDEGWEHAIPLTLNSTTEQSIKNEAFTSNYDGDLYLMYDENYLYVLEVQRKFDWTKVTTEYNTVVSSANLWSAGYNGTQITICENEDITREASLDDAANSTWAHQFSYYPVNSTTGTNAIVPGQQYEGALRVRYCGYSTTADNYQKLKGYFSATELSTLAPTMKTYFTKTSNTSCVMETKIPWSFIRRDAKATAPVAEGFGAKVYMGAFGNYHLNTTFWNKNADFGPFDPIKLISQSNTKIQPDYAYWLDAEKGQFITNNPKAGGKTYEISTAAQLIALSEILENLNYNETVYGLNAVGLANNNEKAYLTRNNTFKLTADIDLNPGVDWVKANDYFKKVYSGQSYDITKLDFKMPVNIFAGFDDFYGILDGQGYSIKGLYNPDGFMYCNGIYDKSTAVGGLIGRLCQGGIVNLDVESGFVGTCTMKGNVQMAGLIGEVRTEAYTDYTKDEGATYAKNAEIIVSNIYVGQDFVVYRYGVRTEETKQSNGQTVPLDTIYAYGGVAGSIWPGTANKSVTIKANFSDIVFAGTMLDAPNNDAKHGGRTSIVLGNNFPDLNTTRTIGNGDAGTQTKLEAVVKNIVANINAAPATAEITKTIHKEIIVTKGSGVPAGQEGKLVALTDGTVAPVKVADMLDTVRWQANKAYTVEVDGKEQTRFDVRFVSEVDASNFANYDSVGHVITITGTKGNVVKTVTVDFKDNTTVYSSVLANGVTIDANNAEKFGVIDGTHLVASVINLPATEGVVYTASVKTVYKIGTTTIEGVAHDLGAIAPLN